MARLLLLAVSFLFSVAAQAQSSGSDPTDPARYFPLGTGNEWQYQVVQGFSDTCPSDRCHYLQRVVVGDSTVTGVAYKKILDREIRLGNVETIIRRLYRFDPTFGEVVELQGSAEAGRTCDLGSDFGYSIECRHYGVLDVFGDAGGSIRLKTYRRTFTSDYLETYGVDLGPMELGTQSNRSYLRYARIVGGMTYGSPVVAPVASEDAAATASTLRLSASPNPTAGPLALQIQAAMAGPVVVEAFDVLGRRVWTETVTLPAGSQSLRVDASAWTPGVYVVRATTPQSATTLRIVRN